MTKQEIQAKIDKIEKQRFWLSMKDHWDNNDFKQDEIWRREIMKLKEDIAE